MIVEVLNANSSNNHESNLSGIPYKTSRRQARNIYRKPTITKAHSHRQKRSAFSVDAKGKINQARAINISLLRSKIRRQKQAHSPLC
jgi:hypothetical protein